MKKRFFSFILFLVLTVHTFSAYAYEPYSFNDPSLWSGGEYTEGGIIISNPVDSSLENGVYHLLDFVPEIHIYKNTMYTLSFDIECTDSLPIAPLSAKASFSYELNSILLTVSGVSSTSHHISVPFASGTTAYFELSFYFLGESEETTFTVSNVKLDETSYKPVRMDISGKTDLYIPNIGQISYPYTAITYDYMNNPMSLIDGSVEIYGNLPQGVSFNSLSQSIIVTSDAKEGSFFYLTAHPSDGSDLEANTVKITLTKNILSNGTFENMTDDTWDLSMASLKQEADNHFLLMNSQSISDDLYSSTLCANYNYYLTQGTLYTLRAKVRSDEKNISTYTSANAMLDGATLSFNISDIGDNVWQEVVCGFIPEMSGIYDLNINFISIDERPIFVDDISFKEETLSPSIVKFSLPKHISIPESDYVKIPLITQSFDQILNPVQDIASLSVYPEDTGVSVLDESLVVSSWAKEGYYAVNAVLSTGAKSVYNIKIDNQSIGGGNFEHLTSENYWITASPSSFCVTSVYNGIMPKKDSYFGTLYMNGSVSALLSSSVKRYDKGQSYVFKVDMLKTYSDIETVVTVLISDIQNSSFDESVVVGQFPLSSEYETITKVFTPSKSITGRLMIAFNTPEEHDSQIILIDDVKVNQAYAEASNVFIYGSPYIDKKVNGTYFFTTNFEGTDTSSFRWLVSSSLNGAFVPIEGENSLELSITSNLDGKYIKFEVTPVSLEGPVAGKSVASSAIQIGQKIPNYSSYSPPAPEEEPAIPEVQDKPEQAPTQIYLKPVNLFYFEQNAKNTYFFDMVNHWAENDVKLMASAGITNGRNDGLFFPNENVTRAEFSAFIIRSFELAPIYYTGNFSDVKDWQWYSGVVQTVSKYELAYGIGSNMFGPELPLTREQMAVMLIRSFKKAGCIAPDSFGDIPFNDTSQISPWAKNEVEQCYKLGILFGKEDNCFYPKSYATRAETIAAIKRMLVLSLQNTPKTN